MVGGPVPEPLDLRVHRVVATATAIDALTTRGITVLRTAADEALVIDVDAVEFDDPWAIVQDDTSWVALAYDHETAARLFPRIASWEPPSAAQPFAQGMAVGLPVKAWWREDDMVILCPACFEPNLRHRIDEVLT
jgi:isocitrate lyase